MEILLSLRPHIFKPAAEYEEDDLLGLGLCLEPDFDYQSRINHFDLYALNDTWDDVMIDIRWTHSNDIIMHAHGRLVAMTAIKMMTIPKEVIDSKTDIHIIIKHKHFDQPLEKNLKPNSATIFAHTERIRILQDRPMQFITFYKLAELLKNPYYKKTKEKPVDLSPLINPSPNKIVRPNTRNELIKLASFHRELDLHYDERVSKNKHRSIIEEQIIKFVNYIDQASNLDIDEVRIIHGKGNGILKQRITELAQDNDDIQSITTHVDGGSSIIKFYKR